MLPGLLAILLSGCATLGPATEPETRIIDTGCDWIKPIFISKQDILTDGPGGTAPQILAHNETGASRCGWEPSAKK